MSKMGYSRTQVNRIHGRALENFPYIDVDIRINT